MSTLENNIKELIQFYVKENYNQYLKDKNIEIIPETDIKKAVETLYSDRKDHLKQFVKESLKVIMEDNPPNDLVVNNILIDIFRDDEFCINRITLEINTFQKKTDIDYNRVL